MSIQSMREGDAICGADGRAWVVEEIAGDIVMTSDLLAGVRKKRQKQFHSSELFCVDAMDGIWQETR